MARHDEYDPNISWYRGAPWRLDVPITDGCRRDTAGEEWYRKRDREEEEEEKYRQSMIAKDMRKREMRIGFRVW